MGLLVLPHALQVLAKAPHLATQESPGLGGNSMHTSEEE